MSKSGLLQGKTSLGELSKCHGGIHQCFEEPSKPHHRPSLVTTFYNGRKKGTAPFVATRATTTGQIAYTATGMATNMLFPNTHGHFTGYSYVRRTDAGSATKTVGQRFPCAKGTASIATTTAVRPGGVEDRAHGH